MRLVIAAPLLLIAACSDFHGPSDAGADVVDTGAVSDSVAVDVGVADAGQDAGDAVDVIDVGADLGAPDVGVDASVDVLDVLDVLDTTSDVPPDVQTCGDGGWIVCGGRCIDPRSNADHCGRCGHLCYGGNVVSGVCEAGECRITECETDRGNCDGNVENGCETRLRSTLNHCGRCGRVCQRECNGGICL